MNEPRLRRNEARQWRLRRVAAVAESERLMNERQAKTQAEQDASDLRDVLWIVDIYRCRKCKRLGIPRGYTCVFCGQDPSEKP
jgi:hypothetical protein